MSRPHPQLNFASASDRSAPSTQTPTRSHAKRRTIAALASLIATLGCFASIQTRDDAAISGTITVPGGRLAYEAAGRGSPVVLIHGGNLDRRMWDAEFEYLRHTHYVVRYDLRGYGQSTRADTTFAAHEDLLALLDSLRIQRTSLIGLSLGGRVTIDFALANPERVDKLVLAAPAVSGGSWPRDNDTTWLPALRIAARQRDSVGMAVAWLESAYIRTALKNPAARTALTSMVRENARHWMDLLRTPNVERFPQRTAAGRLEELRARTLLLIGDADTPLIRAMADSISARAPFVRRVDLVGVGHMVNLEAPSRFRSEVLAFLDR